MKVSYSELAARILLRIAPVALLCLGTTSSFCRLRGNNGHVTESDIGKPGGRAVTVEDCIGMRELGDPRYLDDFSVDQNYVAHFSPDGRRFAILLKRGNLKKDTNDYSLLLFETDTALASPRPETVASFSSSSNRPGIQEVKWVDNHTISFLAENPGESQQLFTVDTETKEITKLTNHATSLDSYAITPNQKQLVFLAARSVETLFDEEAQRTGIPVSSQPLADLLAGEDRWDADLYADLFVKQKDATNEFRVRTKGLILPTSLYLSPNGRYLVLKTSVERVPDAWRKYKDRNLQFRVGKQYTNWVFQYELVDLSTRQAEMLVDAPLSSSRSDAVWLPDSNSVVVSGIYLPLHVSDPVERLTRQSHSFLAEIKVPSLEIIPISSEALRPIEWDPRSNQLLVESTAGVSSAPSLGGVYPFEKNASGWKETRRVLSRTQESERVKVSLEEGMNDPPKLFVTDSGTHQTSLLLDLNPQFRDLKFGHVEDIRFEATDGHRVRAGLYLPPNYVPGSRYPLVIQTHAWSPRRFWIDGPWPTAFAAQPLASNGFIVLQLEEDLSDLSTPGEAPREAASYEGAINYLDRLRMIDRARVGIIGFSRTGLGVEYALTHSRMHFAAATIADGSDGGYFAYLSVVTSAWWRWPDFEGINGGVPFGPDLASWLKKSAGFNLERVKTPVREEAYEPEALLFAWEWYAGLTRLRKPVDLIYNPYGTHVLVRPSQRMASQQGNVDWFCFWLKGEENPGPGEDEQYARWREMRKLGMRGEDKIERADAH